MKGLTRGKRPSWTSHKGGLIHQEPHQGEEKH
jgi:hypothetical protein